MIKAVKLLSPQLFDTPYAIYSEEVPYVRRAALLLHEVLHGSGFPDETQEPSLCWVLLDRDLSNVRFVRRASIFDRENNFYMQDSVKFGLYFALADFSTAYGLQKSKGASFWTRTYQTVLIEVQ